MVRIRNLNTNNVREVKTVDIKHLNDLKKQRDQYKIERDALIDDLSKYEARVSRLEQVREIKDNALKGADIKIKTLERENEQLKKEEKVNRTKASLLTEIEIIKKENEELKDKLKD